MGEIEYVENGLLVPFVQCLTKGAAVFDCGLQKNAENMIRTGIKETPDIENII